MSVRVLVVSEDPWVRPGLATGMDGLSGHIALDGHPVRHHHDVLLHLAPEMVGKTVRAHIIRAGTVHDLVIPVGERP